MKEEKDSLLQEAPVFYPTVEEFLDPMGYVAKIRPLAEAAGICRIIPPDGWAPPFAIDPSTFKFPTRVQNLSRLGAGARLTKDFEKHLRKFMYKVGSPLPSGPVILADEQEKKPLDLYRFYKHVKERGGYVTVCQGERWGEVAQDLGLDAEKYAKRLRLEYKSLLFVYETRSEAVVRDDDDDDTSTVTTTTTTRRQQQQEGQAALEGEEGGSPSSRRRRHGHGVGERESPSSLASQYTAMMEEKPSSVVGRKFLRYFPPQDVFMVGTITGMEGRTRYSTRYVDESEEIAAMKKKMGFNEITGKKDLLVLLCNGTSKAAARAVQLQDFCEVCLRTAVDGPMTECYSCGALRHAPCLESPRSTLPAGDWFCPDCLKEEESDVVLKKEKVVKEEVEDVVEVPSTPLPRAPRDKKEGKRMMMSQQASGAKKKKQVPPPVEELFASFGFQDGDHYTLARFKEKAETWRREYLRRRFGREEVTEEEMEEEFWRVMDGGEVPNMEQDESDDAEDKEAEGVVNNKSKRGRKSKKKENADGSRLRAGGSRAPDELKVEYGSEIDTGAHGSAFPLPAALRKHIMSTSSSSSSSYYPFADLSTKEKERVRSYERSGWNINNLPIATGSMLHHLDVPVTGVVVPWLYVGMSLSAFCWHAEDHYLYSINYLHRGPGTKAWYAIPGAYADAFEALVQELFPELFVQNPDIMLQLVTMVNPHLIARRGIPVYRTRQRVGQFVITFPQAYHAGFNHDFNVAEAVNFAPPDFLPWGGKAQELYRQLHRSPVFSQDQLVVAAAKALLSRPPRETAECLPYLRSELERMKEASRRRAAQARTLGVTNLIDGAQELVLSFDDEEEDGGGPEVTEKGGEGEGEGELENNPGVAEEKNEEYRAPLTRAGRGRPRSVRSSSTALPHTTTTSCAAAAAAASAAGNGCRRRMGLGGKQQQNVRHGLLKGPRCAVCQQYCFLEQIHCGGCDEQQQHRYVCGEHITQACVGGKCSVLALVYRRRCPEDILNLMADKLQERARDLECWRADVETMLNKLEKRVTEKDKVAMKKAREVRAQGPDVSPLAWQCIVSMASLMEYLMGDEVWKDKPTLQAVQELVKRGKDLGTPRQELSRIERAYKDARNVSEEIEALLPQGLKKQGHMRLKSKGGLRWWKGRQQQEEEEGNEEGGGRRNLVLLSHDRLLHLVLFALDYPVLLEKEAGAALRLLKEVTRLRKASWEVLGVKSNGDFAALDACVSRASCLFPWIANNSSSSYSSSSSSLELEGSPHRRGLWWSPQGQLVLHEEEGEDGRRGGGRKKKQASSSSRRCVVQGRWDGRRFQFYPSLNLRRIVGELENEIKLLGMELPESRLLSKGYLERSEQEEEEGEEDPYSTKYKKAGLAALLSKSKRRKRE